MASEATRGLYEKFKTIERTDGRSAPGEKHHGCAYFVLDLNHDEHARDAIRAYAHACFKTHPALAESLKLALSRSFGPTLAEAFTEEMRDGD